MYLRVLALEGGFLRHFERHFAVLDLEVLELGDGIVHAGSVDEINETITERQATTGHNSRLFAEH